MEVVQFIKNLFNKDQSTQVIKGYRKWLKSINDLEAHFESLSDMELKSYTPTLKKQLQVGKTLDDLLPEAFALVREASKRTLNMRHFDVQLIGGMVLHQNRIAEMKTGEGKTLVSTLAAYLNALEEKGVYIVTVNDYLAKRDSEWMGQIYTFLGLNVGLIQSNQDHESKQEAYRADITYGTNNEFGFDYLRDHLSSDLEELCQYRKQYAIIDEVDSILVDEARTPLIISGPTPDNTKIYKKLLMLCKTLNAEEHFEIEEKNKNIILTESGISTLETRLNIDNLYSTEHMELAHIATQALRALHLYAKDVDYVIKDKQVQIVDEFTGRILDGRRYADGLHQAIEAKEQVKIQQESQTLASITYQNYFRLFPKLAGMTGTAKTEEEEFINIYGLDVICIPTNKTITRKDHDDVIYKTKDEKFKAIVKEVKNHHEKGQPMLVGTVAIESSETLSKLFKNEGIKHNVLNAKHHEQEATIIKEAGQKDAVTIATNMAGRGTDIVLGEGVLDLGGLYVIGTERHESRRIDNQLRGRSGRQGDIGESKFFVALNDSLMRLFGSEKIAGVMNSLGMKDDMPIEHSWLNKTIERAQKKVEQYHYSSRKQILEFDNVLDAQRNTIYSLREDILHNSCEKRLILGFDHLLKPFCETPKTTLSNLSKNASQLDTLIALFKDLALKESLMIRFQESLKSQRSPLSLNSILNDMYLDKKASINPEIFNDVMKMIMLRTLDGKWMEHLHFMDNLRDGIGLRAYGQRNPLTEYKIEGFDAFQNLLYSFYKEVSQFIFRVEIVEKPIEEQPVLTIRAKKKSKKKHRR